MADKGSIAAIKAEIDEKIIPNNNAQLITGEKLNDTLQDTVDTLDAQHRAAIQQVADDLGTEIEVRFAEDDAIRERIDEVDAAQALGVNSALQRIEAEKAAREGADESIRETLSDVQSDVSWVTNEVQRVGEALDNETAAREELAQEVSQYNERLTEVEEGVAELDSEVSKIEAYSYDLTKEYNSKKQSSKGLDATGRFVSIGWSFCSPDFIPIGFATKFNYRLRTAAGNLIIAFYASDDEDSFISGVESPYGGAEGVAEVPANAKYIRFCTYDWGDDAYGYFITAVIDTNKIAPQSITRDKLASNSVSTDQIVNGSITTDKIGTLDYTPINNSRNLITSGGVYNAIKQSNDKSTEHFSLLEKSVGSSKFVGVSIQEQSGINISNAPFCSFTKSRGMRVNGQGSKQFVLLYSQGVAVGDVISLGVKVPYSTQDVANVQLAGGWAIEMPFESAKTKSGKGYKIQGETYQRINYKVSGSVEYATQISITTADPSAHWEIWVAANAVINDTMPLAPIMYVYDGGHWDGVVNYNGQSMSIWSLHRALGIPYTIAMTESEYLSEPCQDEVIADIESGFADVITRVGSPYDYKDSDSNVVSDIVKSMNNCLDGNVGADSLSCVFATHAFDKDVLRCVKKSGIELARTFPTYDGVEKYGCKFGDYDMMLLSPQSVNYGSSMPTEFMGFPIILWAHGIGTPQSSHEQSLSGMYADADGNQTIAGMQNILIAQGNGNAATFKSSDFIAFCKKYK